MDCDRRVKRYKAEGSDQITAKLSQAGGNILRCKIHKLVDVIWNMKELPAQWKDWVIATIYKMVDKTKCRYYRSM